ncbi:uncharacterized protein LOC144411895 [Styela clava]
MSDSEQQQIVPSLIDQQTTESIDQQTDKSDLTDTETIEADPAVQQIIESDIIDNNSSNDTDGSGNESPQQQQQQQQQQQGPMIQDLGPEDEIHEEQGPGQEYQVEEPGEGPTDVQPTAPQQAVQQQPAALGGQTGNVIEYHQHVHYYGAPVYQGSVIKGDIVGSKSQVRGSTIGAIGGSQEPPAIGGPGGQAALPWYCEGTSGSSQVLAIGRPEQRPALPWHGEGAREALHPGSVSNQPLALLAPEAQISSPGNEQLEEIEATVPTNEPEVIDSIKPKKKSKKKANRAGIPTASNPELSGAFPLIPPEPSNRRDANVASGARPKTTALHPGSNQPLALLAPGAQISSPGNEQLEDIEATVPTNEPEILDSIKPKKKSKKRPTRGGSNRDPEPVPTPRSPAERSFVDEETLNPNVTTPKVVGSPTASNPEIPEAFPLIPPEPSNRRNANETSGARPKTTGSRNPTSHQPRPSLRPISQAKVQTHQRNDRRLPPTNYARSRSADARYLSQLDETSEYEYSAESFNFTESCKESDNESTLSSVGSLVSHQRFRSYKKSTSTRKAGRKSHRNWMIQTENPMTESESQTSLVHRRDRMNQTYKKPTDDTEAQTDKQRTRDRHLQTDNYNLDMDTQTGPNIAAHISERDIASTEMYVQTDPKQALDNDTQTTILQQTNTPTQTLVKTFQENEFQTDQKETIATFSQTNGTGSHLHTADNKFEESGLKIMEIYEKEEASQGWNLLRWTTSLSSLIALVWGFICCNIFHKDFARQGMAGPFQSKLVHRFFNVDNDTELMKPFFSKVKDVVKLGREFSSKGKYIHAIVAFYSASKLYRQSDRKDESRKGIWTCFSEAGIVAFQLLTNSQTEDIAQNHVIPLMHEMTDFLKPIHSQSQFAEELETKSKEFVKEKKFISATVTLYVAAKLHKETNEGNDSAHGVLSCIEQISLVMEEMIKQKQSKTLSHMISLITEMIDLIGMMEITNYSQFINEMKSKAKEFGSEKKFIPSVVSFYVAAKLHGLDNKGDQSVIGIYQSVDQIPLVVEKMTKQHSMKKIVIDHVIPIMHELLEIVQTIKDSTHKVKVEGEAWCLLNIGLCHGYCDEHQQDANMNNSAIILIERELEEPQTYRIYGRCLNNAGAAYDRMGNIEKAVELFKMSLEAKMNAEDYSSDKDKNDDIESTRKNLRIVESKLSK